MVKIKLSDDSDKKLSGEGFTFTHVISRDQDNFLDLEVEFYVGDKVDIKPQELLLKLEPSITWKEAKFVGKRRIKANSITECKDYKDPYYEDGIKSLLAKFEINFPAFTDKSSDTFNFTFDCGIPTLNGQLDTRKFTLQVQPEII